MTGMREKADLADEICARFNGKTFSAHDEPLEWLRGQIKAALTEARQQALAEAAGIADEKYKGHGSELRTLRARNYEHAGQCIAQAINALAQKG